MRHCYAIVFTLFSASLLPAQETAPVRVDTVPAASPEPRQIYQIDFVEFSLKDKADADLKSAELVKLLQSNSDRVQRVESVRLTVVSGVRSMVSFGKTVPVTAGVTQSQFGKTKNVRDMQVGTMVRVEAQPQSDSLVQVTLNFESARVKPAKGEDEMPEITKFTVGTELQLKPGTPTLVTGSSADDSTYLVATLRDAE